VRAGLAEASSEIAAKSLIWRLAAWKLLTKNKNTDSMEHMKTQTIGLTLALCFLEVSACFAADPHMGTWKLNEAKSKITPGTLIFNTIIYKSMFGKVKVEGRGHRRRRQTRAHRMDWQLRRERLSGYGRPDLR
jgi:hypothetical protein